MGQIHILSDNSTEICIISQDQKKRLLKIRFMFMGD